MALLDSRPEQSQMSEVLETTANPAKGEDVEEHVQESEEQKQAREAAEQEARDKARREKEARAQALTLEIVGDLPYAEVKPPENVLFVCKLNPVTEDEDLDTIFSRFGPIVSCEVIRDKRTKDSLQYAFIEFENQKDCEQAYFKMQGVLIDDHRIHVDFSQSVSRLSDKWRTTTNTKRAQSGGGFGGVEGLEKKRQYRAMDRRRDDTALLNGEKLIFDKDELRQARPLDSRKPQQRSMRSRSRSPKRHEPRREPRPSEEDRRRRNRSYERRDPRGDDRRRRP